MSVAITGHQIENEAVIMEAINCYWPFAGEWLTLRNSGAQGNFRELSATADGSLSGSVGDFADRIAAAAWIANGTVCEVVVSGTCLEFLPAETVVRDQDDYDRLQSLVQQLQDRRAAQDDESEDA